MVFCLGEPPRRFLLLYLHFIFWSSFLTFILLLYLHLSMFFIHISFTFQHHPSPFCGLSPGFYTHFILSAQPITEWLRYFHFQLFWYLLTASATVLIGPFYTHGHFLPYAPPPTFLAQPAFIKASLGAGSSSLKFAGLHTDPRNTDPAHLFVWFTVIHNLHIQKNSFLNSTIYYHELLVVKSLVYMLLTRFELFSLVQSHM